MKSFLLEEKERCDYCAKDADNYVFDKENPKPKLPMQSVRVVGKQIRCDRCGKFVRRAEKSELQV